MKNPRCYTLIEFQMLFYTNSNVTYYIKILNDTFTESHKSLTFIKENSKYDAFIKSLKSLWSWQSEKEM